MEEIPLAPQTVSFEVALPVLHVTNQGMPDCQHVNSDLVSEPCVKLQCNQTVTLTPRLVPGLARTNWRPEGLCEDSDLRVCRLATLTHTATT